jgi:hypothetical protein
MQPSSPWLRRTIALFTTLSGDISVLELDVGVRVFGIRNKELFDLETVARLWWMWQFPWYLFSGLLFILMPWRWRFLFSINTTAQQTLWQLCIKILKNVRIIIHSWSPLVLVVTFHCRSQDIQQVSERHEIGMDGHFIFNVRITIAILDIIRRPVFSFKTRRFGEWILSPSPSSGGTCSVGSSRANLCLRKYYLRSQNISLETGLCLRHQVEPTLLGPVEIVCLRKYTISLKKICLSIGPKWVGSIWSGDRIQLFVGSRYRHFINWLRYTV